MAAPKGNKFWEARSSHGANPKFEHSTDLWDACLEYFEWVEDNPLKEARVAQCKGEPKVIELDKMRAMTIGGLCNFLDICHDTWIEWRNNRDDLSEVIKKTESIIREQKFSGAAADLLNANIIARDLGLKDTSVNELTGKDGGAIEFESKPSERIAGRIASLASRTEADTDTKRVHGKRTC